MFARRGPPSGLGWHSCYFYDIFKCGPPSAGAPLGLINLALPLCEDVKTILKTPFKHPMLTHSCLALGAVLDSGLACHDFLLFHSPLVFHPYFLVQLSLRGVSLWELLWSVFPNWKFSSLPLLFIPTQSTLCHFVSSVSLFESNFPVLLDIPAGDCSWRGSGGQGCGLTLGWINDLHLCVFVLCFPRLF